MKKILTDNIIENTRRQPFNKASLEHIQEAFLEVFTSFLKQFTEDTANYFRLHGLVDSDGSSTAWDISAGAVYFNGEVFQVDGFVGTDPVDVPVLTIATTYRAGDPVKFSDNNDFNVHEIRKMVITLGAPGSGDVNFSSLQQFGQSWVTSPRISSNAVDNTKVNSTVFAGDVYNHTDDLDTFVNGKIQFIIGDAPNAPVAGGANKFAIICFKADTNGSVSQLAIQVAGANAGDMYYRTKPALGAFTAWGAAINT